MITQVPLFEVAETLRRQSCTTAQPPDASGAVEMSVADRHSGFRRVKQGDVESFPQSPEVSVDHDERQQLLRTKVASETAHGHAQPRRRYRERWSRDSHGSQRR